LITVTGAALLIATGAVVAYRSEGLTLLTAGLMALAVLGMLGIVEAATTRIVLTDEDVETGSVWSRRRYRAADVASVAWEGGAGVALKLTSGGWAKLPEMGYNSLGLANTLRAWVKRAERGRGGHSEPQPRG
jgi:hypothetical protein